MMFYQLRYTEVSKYASIYDLIHIILHVQNLKNEKHTDIRTICIST